MELTNPTKSPFYRTPRPRKHAPYPWARWWSMLSDPGDFIELVQGQDFTPKVENFRKQLELRSRLDGVPVRTKIMARNRNLRVTRMKSRPGRRAGSYPWNLWLDGEARRLLPGLDFHVTPSALVSHAGAVAKTRGLKVRSTTKHTPGALWIQAYTPDEEPAAPEVPLISGHDPTAVGSETETPQEV